MMIGIVKCNNYTSTYVMIIILIIIYMLWGWSQCRLLRTPRKQEVQVKFKLFKLTTNIMYDYCVQPQYKNDSTVNIHRNQNKKRNILQRER